MTSSGRIPPNKTAIALAILLLCLLGMVFSSGVAMWMVEHYMDASPADWPYPGSFLDRANDVACGLILLPAGSIGRFSAWLIFFPVPIVIAASEGKRQKTILYALCILLPYSYADIIFETVVSEESLRSIMVLVLILTAPFWLIGTWVSLCKNPWEKNLLRANLIVLWLTFAAGDILLGMNVHNDYCKVYLTRLLTH